ncbi:MAG: hypothetical protein H0T94_07165 [Acidimicrobiia bacterium]|nr:hypothetical protein [Acidimicrobiia bacterium]
MAEGDVVDVDEHLVTGLTVPDLPDSVPTPWYQIGESGAKRLGLHVFEANAAARRLYESKGFVVTNIKPGHIDMSKDLVGA